MMFRFSLVIIASVVHWFLIIWRWRIMVWCWSLYLKKNFKMFTIKGKIREINYWILRSVGIFTAEEPLVYRSGVDLIPLSFAKWCRINPANLKKKINNSNKNSWNQFSTPYLGSMISPCFIASLKHGRTGGHWMWVW